MHQTTSQLLVQYAHYHRDPRNIATHFIGVPLIVFAISALLARLQTQWGELTLSADVGIWCAVAIWYLRGGMSIVVAATIALTGALVACAHPLGTASQTQWLVASLGAFLTGWAFQFAGHFWEGRKPAFLDDLRGLLVGPLFVVAELLFLMGALKELRQHISENAGPTRRRTAGNQGL